MSKSPPLHTPFCISLECFLPVALLSLIVLHWVATVLTKAARSCIYTHNKVYTVAESSTTMSSNILRRSIFFVFHITPSRVQRAAGTGLNGMILHHLCQRFSHFYLIQPAMHKNIFFYRNFFGFPTNKF